MKLLWISSDRAQPPEPKPAGLSEWSLTQYTGLRSEISQRIGIRHNHLAATAAAFIALAGFNQQLSIGRLILLYPIAAMFVAIGWMQNEIRIRLLGRFIKDCVEKHQAEPGWETYLHNNEQLSKARVRFFAMEWQPSIIVLAGAGLFLGSQVTALAFGWWQILAGRPVIIEILIGIAGFCSLLVGCAIILYSRKQDRADERAKQAPLCSKKDLALSIPPFSCGRRIALVIAASFSVCIVLSSLGFTESGSFPAQPAELACRALLLLSICAVLFTCLAVRRAFVLGSH